MRGEEKSSEVAAFGLGHNGTMVVVSVRSVMVVELVVVWFVSVVVVSVVWFASVVVVNVVSVVSRSGQRW